MVTGGGGFLGARIVSMLLDRGWQVTSFSRQRHNSLVERGAVYQLGNLADSAAVDAAVRGVDVVFHVAARAGIWGDLASYYAVNVTGTQNVLAACRRNGVRKIVYTSTPSVVFSGQDIRHASEGTPLAGKHLSHYSTTKAMAERLVLDANGPDLATVALRPHIIWGPGDNQLLPRLVERHRAGRLVLIGRGDNLIDTTFVDNAASAHIEAAGRLEPGAAPAGRPYFISQGDPRPFATMLNALLGAVGLPPVRRSIPVPVAYAAAWLLETGYRMCAVADEPALTRYSVLQMARDHYFDISAARRDLGYAPTVSIEEGLDRMRDDHGLDR